MIGVYCPGRLSPLAERMLNGCDEGIWNCRQKCYLIRLSVKTRAGAGERAEHWAIHFITAYHGQIERGERERESGNITLLCGVMLWLVLSKSTNIATRHHPLWSSRSPNYSRVMDYSEQTENWLLISKHKFNLEAEIESAGCKEVISDDVDVFGEESESIGDDL